MIGEDPSASKVAWRRAYLTSRRARLKQTSATRRLVTLPQIQPTLATLGIHAYADTAAGYQPLESEVDVTPILAAWTELGGNALIPTADAMSAGRFDAPRWRDFGEGEDAVEAPAFSSSRLILVPGLAFGTDGARLGRGAGWYDKALAGRRKDALVLGVCFENEVVGPGLVPVEAHDVKVGGVLTPAGLQLF